MLRVLLTGASGSLGAYVLDELGHRGHRTLGWSHSGPGRRGSVDLVPVDLEGVDIEARLDSAAPDLVIHLAAMSGAEAVRLDPDRGRRVNVEATARIARWCGQVGLGLVFASTDLVFDGSRAWNREDDPAEPVLAYGRTKREGEPHVLAVSRGLVTRISLLYGFSRSGRPAYFDRTVEALRRGEPQALFEDEYRTPLDLATAAKAIVGLAEVGATGIVHVGGAERMSRHDLIHRAATALGLDPGLVVPNRREDARLAEPRPADVSLDTGRLASILPDLVRPTVEEVCRGRPEGRSGPLWINAKHPGKRRPARLRRSADASQSEVDLSRSRPLGNQADELVLDHSDLGACGWELGGESERLGRSG